MPEHHWDPIYLPRPVYKENKQYLYGICMHCKKVMSAENLIKRLNKLERLCGSEVELEDDDSDS